MSAEPEAKRPKLLDDAALLEAIQSRLAELEGALKVEREAREALEARVTALESEERESAVAELATMKQAAAASPAEKRAVQDEKYAAEEEQKAAALEPGHPAHAKHRMAANSYRDAAKKERQGVESMALLTRKTADM
eukprot:CAMPEP_0119273462 /NCGR_PEP_ID=MMETSP1329-20130426/10411_1 /TAXON_ID=114041 /ORGANISM="Genus nov. species nov., Strain RCC1024" /LENGTH=136 /DNA_ID=CAMNT_0007273675 /DNA_START=14 /DNA_END=421 /DNA_ORIENTATION=+